MPTRTSVSLTEELRRRMTEASDGRVNWSGVASAAFEAKLAQLEASRGIHSFEGLVQRLQESKLRLASEDYLAGSQAGRAWLHECAEWDALERLEASRDRARALIEHSDAASLPESFLRLLEMDIDPQEFWGSSYADGEVGAEFLSGFTDAALVIFRRVKARLAD